MLFIGEKYKKLITMSKKQYQQLDPISHILQRPDMYCGSTRFRQESHYISSDDFQITQKVIKTCPAIVRFFLEVLSNATDNVERSKKVGINCTKIKVYINRETGETSIWNDGDIVQKVGWKYSEDERTIDLVFE